MASVDLDEVYRTTPPEKIPWNLETPPEALVDLLDSGEVTPCRALDLGCGTGNHAVTLAGRGFEVTGVDISPNAVRLAGENAESKGVAERCRFVAADILGGLPEVSGPFRFAHDWEVLHHIFPEHRERYITTVHDKLEPGGRYLSVCFSEESPQFGGTGKVRKTPLDTRLYFSSEGELETLFETRFRILDLRTIEIAGKFAPHLAVYAFMEKG